MINSHLLYRLSYRGTTADGSGNWSFTPGTPLANGTVIVATAKYGGSCRIRTYDQLVKSQLLYRLS